MSKESANWLNTQTRIGFTDKRGHAWHYRAEEQGEKSNHFPGAVPLEAVRDLFDWEVVEGDVSSTATVMSEDGVNTFTVTDPNRKAMLRPPGTFGPDDNGAIFGLFKSGYQGHQYMPWLVEEVAIILDDEVQIGTAGLLKGGAIAFVSIEVPDNFTTPEGVVFRPHLLATTSFDGSIATTYGRKVQLTVCDNTLEVAMREKGQQLKVKHSRYSHLKLADAREALALVHTMADEFSAEVAELTSIKVSDGDWAKFLDTLAPMPEDKGRAQTMATNKRDTLNRLWNHDERVAPWRGTVFGAMQAVNTMSHHEGIVRGSDRAERNMLRAVNGEAGKLDRQSIVTLMSIVG